MARKNKSTKNEEDPQDEGGAVETTQPEPNTDA